MLCSGYVSFSKGHQVLFLLFIGTSAGQNEIENEFSIFFFNSIFKSI